MSELDWIARAGAKAKGKRPAFFDDPAADRMLSMLTALTAEVSVMRQRLDTVERLLDSGAPVTRAAIEAYTPDAAAAQERGELIRDYIARVMRGVAQEVEAMAAPEPAIEEVSAALRDM